MLIQGRTWVGGRHMDAEAPPKMLKNDITHECKQGVLWVLKNLPEFKESLAQEVRQKSNILECKSRG